MNVDQDILQLPHIGLKNRAILPELSGIYYVIDENFIIWYIGKAKNLRTRWAGDSHHRLDQLQKQRKKLFTIYYELVPESLLDATEQERIEQHSPQLNGTKVKVKKLRPTETLLRETLANLAPYSFILGVESARKQDLKFIEDSLYWRDNGRVKKAILPLTVIHICINVSELSTGTSGNSAIRFIRNIFRKRSNYSKNWESASKYKNRAEYSVKVLLVNGFVIEVCGIWQEALKYIQDYELTQLANVDMRAVDEASLVIIKNKCLLNCEAGVFLAPDNRDYPYHEFCRKAIERIYPYKQDLVKLLFNEEIALVSKPQVLPTDTRTLRDSKTGLLVRLANLADKKGYMTALLTERGLDLNLYRVNKYLESIPKDDNYIDNIGDTRMTVFIKPFLWNLPEVYLAATVDRVFWLLLETYLSDFTKVNLNAEEKYTSKAYVSPRRFIVPATLTVTLNGKWKAGIPFGSKDDMSYKAVVDIITSRLQASGIPKLKFSFTLDSIRS
ncbi:hypothetical protein NDA07_08615 [Microcoleus vaginatus DQ-U2]|uniref:hypothetical protein n=1 Tax=Microcoleus vaginatus TaxID=119532 RepID=UPI00168947E8|nr:hypothetical protein [Microcoleus sp. FACHB-DQ6]